MIGVVGSTDIGEERSCRDSENTSKEISRPSVASSCGSRVRSVGANHVVNRGHVNTVICNSDDGGKDHRSNPGNWWASASPSKSDEANRQAWCSIQKPPETGFVLSSFIVRLSFSFLDIPSDGRDERNPANEITDSDRDESKTLGSGNEVILLVHQ